MLLTRIIHHWTHRHVILAHPAHGELMLVSRRLLCQMLAGPQLRIFRRADPTREWEPITREEMMRHVGE